MDVKVAEAEPLDKDVMSEVVAIAEGVVQAIKAITKEGRNKEEEKNSGVELSFSEMLEASMTETKAEDDLGQMIACVIGPSSKLEKKWDYARHIDGADRLYRRSQS